MLESSGPGWCRVVSLPPPTRPVAMDMPQDWEPMPARPSRSSGNCPGLGGGAPGPSVSGWALWRVGTEAARPAGGRARPPGSHWVWAPPPPLTSSMDLGPKPKPLCPQPFNKAGHLLSQYKSQVTVGPWPDQSPLFKAACGGGGSCSWWRGWVLMGPTCSPLPPGPAWTSPR